MAQKQEVTLTITIKALDSVIQTKPRRPFHSDYDYVLRRCVCGLSPVCKHPDKACNPIITPLGFNQNE